MKWSKTTCNHTGCNKKAASGKYYCNTHLHSQRKNNPVNSGGTSYGKMSKKEIAKRNKK